MNLDPKMGTDEVAVRPPGFRPAKQWKSTRGGRQGDARRLDAAAALDLLKGTPINCLVVEWAAGAPEDAAQQEALKPLIEAGRGKGISFVGKVAAKDIAAAATSAKAAGLAAVLITEPAKQELELPAILQSARDRVAWTARPHLLCIGQRMARSQDGHHER